MVNLYEHIEQLGIKHGFKTITALCREAGVPRATMTELKMGRSKDLSKPNALKFAEALGVSLDEIYGKKENTPAPSEDSVGVLTKEELSRISAAMAEMNEEGRERAVEMVEDLAAGGRFKKHCSDAMDKEA